MTRQRRMILEELRNNYTHPTASEVYELVRQKLPRISLGTVYRNLEILSKQGLIRKLELAGAQKRFDGTIEMHYHVRCLSCGRVEDIPVTPVTIREDMLQDMSDFQITGHRLEFVGLCPKCKRNQKAKKSKIQISHSPSQEY